MGNESETVPIEVSHCSSQHFFLPSFSWFCFSTVLRYIYLYIYRFWLFYARYTPRVDKMINHAVIHAFSYTLTVHATNIIRREFHTEIFSVEICRINSAVIDRSVSFFENANLENFRRINYFEIRSYVEFGLCDCRFLGWSRKSVVDGILVSHIYRCYCETELCVNNTDTVVQLDKIVCGLFMFLASLESSTVSFESKYSLIVYFFYHRYVLKPGKLSVK